MVPFLLQGNGTSNKTRFYGKLQHGRNQEEVSKKQSEVFKKAQNIVRIRTHEIFTCICVILRAR